MSDHIANLRDHADDGLFNSAQAVIDEIGPGQAVAHAKRRPLYWLTLYRDVSRVLPRFRHVLGELHPEKRLITRS
jgi:hypothetical protein